MSSESLNVVCVKVGDRYHPDYVNKLHNAVKRHLQMDFTFWVLTDNGEGIHLPAEQKMIMEHPLPGWWSKMYLFSNLPFKGPLLYLDLDQIILGDITPIVWRCMKEPFACYADHISYQDVKLGTAWMQFESGKYQDIFDHFWKLRDTFMEAYASGGDQVYLGGLKRLQDAYYFNEDFPGAVKSYKWDIAPTNQPPDENTVIINFHGQPKPADVAGIPWVKEHWI